MANRNQSGVFKLDNGYWAYRFSLLIDGKRICKRKTVDKQGNKLKSKKHAILAKEQAIKDAHLERKREHKIVRRKFGEVFKEYCEVGRSDKAFGTIRKQDSLWENHIEKKFGNLFIDEITVEQVNDYLSELYYTDGYSFQYVESFLKFFYLVFGQAYTRNYLGMNDYSKLCVNKDTKIKMPKLKSDDDLEIVFFNDEQLNTLDNYFKHTSLELAYNLGRYLGIRINECFGLKWENVDLEKGVITIDRQMQYQNGLIRLVPVKTRNANRKLYMNDKLKELLTRAYWERKITKEKNEKIIFQNQRMIEDLDGSTISSIEMVNCCPDGKLQTVNSVKYHTREIKKQFGIEFKFHYLRHTYGTKMAELNTPSHLLCDQMGHGKIEVTRAYYLAVSKKGVDILRQNLNQL